MKGEIALRWSILVSVGLTLTVLFYELFVKTSEGEFNNFVNSSQWAFVIPFILIPSFLGVFAVFWLFEKLINSKFEDKKEIG